MNRIGNLIICKALEYFAAAEELKVKVNKVDIAVTCAVHRTLADHNQLKILAILNIQPLCVCAIKEIMSISYSKSLSHL